MKKAAVLIACALGVAACIVFLVGASVHHYLNEEAKSELQVVLHWRGRPVSGHIEVRNATGKVVASKSIGTSGETIARVDPGHYAVTGTMDGGRRCSRETVSVDNSPNAVFVRCPY